MEAKHIVELKRLSILVSEIEYQAWLEDSFGNDRPDMTQLDNDFDDDALRNTPAEKIFEVFVNNNIYFEYSQCDDFLHWIKINIGRYLEFTNKDIFSKYGSISCVVSIKTDYRSGNAEGKKAVGRYWTTLNKLREKFGKHLETVRKTGKMKQKDLDLTKSQISLIENGNSNPTLDSLLLIARGLKKELKFV